MNKKKLEKINKEMNENLNEIDKELNEYYEKPSEKENVNGEQAKLVIFPVLTKFFQKTQESFVKIQDEWNTSIDKLLNESLERQKIRQQRRLERLKERKNKKTLTERQKRRQQKIIDRWERKREMMNLRYKHQEELLIKDSSTWRKILKINLSITKKNLKIQSVKQEKIGQNLFADSVILSF